MAKRAHERECCYALRISKEPLVEDPVVGGPVHGIQGLVKDFHPTGFWAKWLSAIGFALDTDFTAFFAC